MLWAFNNDLEENENKLNLDLDLENEIDQNFEEIIGDFTLENKEEYYSDIDADNIFDNCQNQNYSKNKNNLFLNKNLY